jgi:hypothetical protein
MSIHSLIIPVRTAQQVLREFCISQPSQIDIEAIAAELGVYPQYAPLQGCDARLLLNVKQGSGIATVNSSISEIARKRFSLAHEIGHFKLHSKQKNRWECTGLDFLKWYLRNDEEPEANTFAAELLIPEDIFRKYCFEMKRKPGFSSVSELAQIFNTSLTATAIRYVSIGNYPCALIASQDGKILWFRASNDFYHRVRSVGSKVDTFSCAGDYFIEGNVPPDRPESVEASCWLEESNSNRRVKIFEQAIVMRQYNIVLSLIWEE